MARAKNRYHRDWLLWVKSVDTSETTGLFGRIAALAAEDGRDVRDALRDAVTLYLDLPSAARRSLGSLKVIGTPEDRAAIGLAAARAIVQIGFDAARRHGSEAAARAYPNGAIDTEEAVADEAVRLSRGARAATG